MTERTKYWRRHLDRWKRSGLSQVAFCRREGLKPVTFSWWKRKLAPGATNTRRRKAGTARVSWSPDRAKFAEVRVSGIGMGAYEVVLSRDLVIRLPADFDPDKVARLIASVKAAC